MAIRLEPENQLYWRVMSALQLHYGEFAQRTVIDIVGSQHRRGVEGYFVFLLNEKAITVVRRGVAPAPHYYGIVNSGEAPPLRRGHQGGGERQQALWTAMRSLRTFSAPELALSASTDELPISQETAGDYAKALQRVGYLREAGTAPRQKRTAIFALVATHNTGPRAPIVERTGTACFDLNLMRSVNPNGQATAWRAA